MTIKEILEKNGIESEKIEAIEKEMKEAKLYTTSLENIDVRYKKLKEQKESVDEELKTANGTIETLKKAGSDNEELQKKIVEYEETIETLKKDAESKSKMYSLKEALEQQGVLDTDYMIYKIGQDNFTFNSENKPVGVEELLKPFRENQATAHLFKQKQDYKPNGGNGNNVKNPWAKESRNLTEQGRLLRENRALAIKLAAEAGVTII